MICVFTPASAKYRTAWQAASQDIYNAQQAGAGQGPGPQAGEPAGQPEGSKGDDGEVTDVDFEEVK